jgi:sec-independent protein translocase protein TatC
MSDATPPPEQETVETLTSHLEELRTRVINCAYIVTLGSIVGYMYSDKLFEVIRQPIKAYLPDGGLIFTNPVDKFAAFLRISIFAGLVLTCPFWLYQLWRFIAPGLYAKEKKYSLVFIFSGSGLFCTGLAFAYFLVFPMAFNFLLNFGGNVDKPMITIDEYLSFITTTSVVFGLMFEMPLVLVILGMMGVIEQRTLRESRRYAIVLLSVISALVTPPDVLSMFLLLIPMILLYELSIILVGALAERSRQGS